MLPSYYEFHNPVRVISGNTALENLPSELRMSGAERPLLVTGKKGMASKAMAEVKRGFADSGMVIGGIADDVGDEASLAVVRHLAGIFRKNNCDSFIALGGKAVADTVKCANILVSESSDDLMLFAGYETLVKPLRPFVSIPAASKSGSPVTSAALIVDIESNVSLVFQSRFLLPDLVVLDQRTLGGPGPDSLAASGMGSLCRCIEALTGPGANPMVNAYAAASIDILRQALVSAVRNSSDPKLLLAMGNVDAMAGIAASNTVPGIVQALGTAIASTAGIAEDVAMGVVLPACLEFNLSRSDAAIAGCLLPLAGPDDYARTPELRRAHRTIDVVRELQKTLHDLDAFPLTLKAAGMQQPDLELISESVLNDLCIMTNPREVRKEDVRKIVLQAFE